MEGGVHGVGQGAGVAGLELARRRRPRRAARGSRGAARGRARRRARAARDRRDRAAAGRGGWRRRRGRATGAVRATRPSIERGQRRVAGRAAGRCRRARAARAAAATRKRALGAEALHERRGRDTGLAGDVGQASGGAGPTAPTARKVASRSASSEWVRGRPAICESSFSITAMPDLSDRIALVTGASRGAGAAIAAVLGEAGATVYVTGPLLARGRADRGPARHRRGRRRRGRPPAAAPGSASSATTPTPAQVEALVARIGADHGRLDVLVNNAWGGYEAARRRDASPRRSGSSRCERRWDAMFGAGVWPTMLTSHRAAPLLAEGGAGRLHHRLGPAAPTSAARSTTRPRRASRASPSPWPTTCASAG